jgi:hypothetical protein
MAAGIAAATAADGGNPDYAVELMTPSAPMGPAAIVKLRLVHTPSGAVVSNATIFETRLDMGPDGMAAMTSDLRPIESAEPGIYAFEANLAMAGRWALTLAAKVEGAAEPVRAQVVITATQ